jgi:hypothetical protein
LQQSGITPLNPRGSYTEYNYCSSHFLFYSEFKRVSFVLSAPGRSEPLYEREMMINTPRVVRVEIPETAPRWKLVKNMCGRWLLGVPQLDRFTLVLRSDGWNSRQN